MPCFRGCPEKMTSLPYKIVPA